MTNATESHETPTDRRVREMVEGRKISRSLAKVRQGWELTAIYVHQSGARLRVRIRRDSYDHQSHAVVEAWAPRDLRWNEVHAAPYSALLVTVVDASRPPNRIPLVSTTEARLSPQAVKAFAADEFDLLAVADRVLVL
jgi:hypothetical protein